MILRSVVLPAFAIVAVVFADCTVPIPWAVNPNSAPPAPATPQLTTEEHDSAVALGRDALLDPDDVPEGVTAIGDGQPLDAVAQGSVVIDYGAQVTVWHYWVDDASDLRFFDYRTVFAEADPVAAYVPERAAQRQMAGFVEPVARFGSDTTALEYRFEVSGVEHAKLILLRAVGRVLIELEIDTLADPGMDARVQALLDNAVQRTMEAISATH